MFFNFSDSIRNTGYLVIRVGFGFMIMLHGFPKIMGGPETWEQLGMAMGNLGITFAPVFWGFMAAITEFVGGIFLMLGFFHRLTALLLTITMFVATVMHISAGDPFMPAVANPIKMGIVFIGLFLMGPKTWALDNLINKRRKKG